MGTITQKLFERVHQNHIIYNTCWEDPRCDRRLLNFENNSRILMITSAGCNALEYLLDDVQRIDCVDMNYRQNAVLALKIALFKHGDHDLLFRFFGKGKCENAHQLYKQHLRHRLNSDYQEFWDKKIKYFSGKGIRPSFYYRGTSGFLAYAFKSYTRLKPSLRRQLDTLFNSPLIAYQEQHYERAKQLLFSPILNKIVNHQYTLTLAGVPKAQAALYKDDYQNYPGGYLGASFDKVFKDQPVRENYFYSVYWNGEYEPDRCPSYLKAECFDIIKSRVDRIHLHTMSLEDYARKSEKTFTHYILLDHMDWMAQVHPELLLSEWEAFFQKASPSAKVLFRSAADNIEWLPENIKNRINFDSEITADCDHIDRVGTYASTWVGQINENV